MIIYTKEKTMPKHLLAAFCLTLACGLPHAALAQDLPSSLPPEQTPAPPDHQGVRIVPLDKQPVPEILKNQARSEIAQMKSAGSIDVPDEHVDWMQRARENKAGRLKPMTVVSAKLGIQPANVDAALPGGARLLGAAEAGGLVENAFTGLIRLYVVPGHGLVALEENDMTLADSGLSLIEEAINAEVRGGPAVFTVKKGASGGYLSSLVWATDRKFYTLSMNRKATADDLMRIADSIVD
jgi:hypothetical protein